MADLSLSAGAMCDAIEAYTGIATVGNALGYLNKGYAEFLRGQFPIMPGDPRSATIHEWSFLRPSSLSFRVWATTSTTLSGAPVYLAPTSTVTVNDAVLYASMIGKNLVVGANSYAIASITSTTVCKVTGDAHAEINGATATITANGIYPLPDDFGGLIGLPVYQYVSGQAFPDWQEGDPEEIWAKHRDDATTDDPYWYAIVPRAFTAATGQRWDFLCWPIPATSRTHSLLYRVLPAVLTDSDTVYPVGGADHANTILEYGLKWAERLTGDTSAIHARIAGELMLGSIALDALPFASGGAVSSMAEIDAGMGKSED